MTAPWGSWPPIPPSGASGPVSTDDVSNTSTVAGATATDALNTLASSIATIAGWLTYSADPNPANGTWIRAAGGTTFLPEATGSGQHVAVLVGTNTTAAISCTLSTFQIGRSVYNAGETIAVRPGGWYEWVSIDAGEDFRWIPVASGFDARAPLEQSPTAVSADPPPNQWILSTDASGVAHTPSNPKSGDSFAIFVNATSAAIVPQTGQSILQADGGTLATAPSSITVIGAGYYEWIWIQSSTTWFPRQNVLTPNLNGTQKQPVRFVCPTNDTLSGLAARDGVTPVAGDRALAAFQTTGSANGIYIAASGAWTRAVDANTNAKVKAGLSVYVNEGTLYNDTIWALATNDPIVLGSTTLSFGVVMKGTATPQPITASNTGAAGTASRWAPVDHSHEMRAPNPALNNFRITNDFTTPISPDRTAFNTIFLEPYNGLVIALWFGSAWYHVTMPPAQHQSVNLSGATAGVPTDIFAVQNGFTALNLEIAHWSSPTARATALTQQDGVWVKSGAVTRRYLGTVLPDSATTYTHVANPASGSKAVCGIWNADNRIRAAFTYLPSFASAPPVATNVWEAYGGATTPHIQGLVGLAQNAVSFRIDATANPSSSGETAVSVGVGSTTVPNGTRTKIGGLNQILSINGSYSYLPAVGRSDYNMLSFSSSATAAVYGAQSPMQAGMIMDALI